MPTPTKHDQLMIENGVALVIVLTFVVLLTGLVVAFFSLAITERQISNSNVNQARADILAKSCLDIIVGGLKEEIAEGSTASTEGDLTVYTPTTPRNILPTPSGTPSGIPEPIPNLVRRSIRADPITAPGVSSHASAINSETSPSLNGRSVTKAEWNAHYLIPKANTGNDATDPITTFVAPDWIIVTRSGISEKTDSDIPTMRDSANTNFALGRFAYLIYDEGGLFDVNVGGYPTNASGSLGTNAPVGNKGTLALADMTQIIPGNATIAEKQAATNKVVGWRNYATGQPNGRFPFFTFTAASGSIWYTNFVTNNTSGFLTVSSNNVSGLTDQAFSSRKQLIKLRRSLDINVNALQYMTTFTRELNNASWNNAATQRVTANFVRRDGTVSKLGELLFRRFPISEIGWLGPAGILPPGDPATVKRDFGLVWSTNHWDYYGADGNSVTSSISPITGNREPEFFQLLAFANPTAVTGELLSIGASLIDQWDGDNTTTWIEYANVAGPPNPKAWGMEHGPPTPVGAPPPPSGAVFLNRPFKNVGEFGYAYKNATKTLNFYSATSADAAILDLCGASVTAKRAGIVSLNTHQELVLRAILSEAIATDPSTPISSTRRNSTSAGLIAATSVNPATSRQDLARLTAECGITGGEEIREVVARALADTCQTRTWNLMIDVITQSGRYPPTATMLSQFVVEGEKRYWLHLAIDRFTGEVIDKQLEPVYD